tara:strand:+ start:8431 stop:9108 length:678 start_codon:yes stop_codon:yes gene_type:complete
MNFRQFLTESIWDDIKEKWWNKFLTNIKVSAPKHPAVLNPEIQKPLYLKSYDSDLKRFRELNKKGLLYNDEKDISTWMNKDRGIFLRLLLSAEHRISLKQERKIAKSGSKKIFEDDSVVIMQITTWEASCYYGRGTKWCISSRDEQGPFKNISQGKNIYFLFDKKQNTKYAIVAYPAQDLNKTRPFLKVWNVRDLDITDSQPNIISRYIEYFKVPSYNPDDDIPF